MIRQTFNIHPLHRATIQSIARNNGNCSDSAALRSIIDKFTEAGKTLHAYRQGNISEKHVLDELDGLFLFPGTSPS
jgi:hypothetical protein